MLFLLATLTPSPAWADLPDTTATRINAPSFGPRDYFGAGLCSGDFDGDGYVDLAISTPKEAYDDEALGVVYTWMGGPEGLSEVPAATLTAPAELGGASFGVTLHCGGDVNGDGLDDLIVAAPNSDLIATSGGGLWLYPASAQGFDAPQAIAPSPVGSGDHLGYAAVIVGDLNGDGFDELAVSSQLSGATGAVFLFHGAAQGADPDSALLLQGSDVVSYDHFGFSVDGAGDVDGDGFDDLIASAPNHQDLNDESGKVYVYFGGEAGLDVASEQRLLASDGQLGDAFGSTVTGAGDLDGDGYADVAVSAPDRDLYTGAVFVYLGSAGGVDPDSEQRLQAPRAAAREAFGEALDGGHDADGDGHDDLIIGQPYRTVTDDTEGVGWVFFGASVGVDAAAPQRLAPPDFLPGDGVGERALSVGDIDGDGDSELLLGAVERGGGWALLYEGGCESDRVFHLDADGDGFGDPDLTAEGCGPPLGYVDDASDCDDDDAGAFPGAEELPDDGVDQDCDGQDAEGGGDDGGGDGDGGGDAGCGCAQAPAGPSPLLLGLLALLLLRRQERRSLSQDAI